MDERQNGSALELVFTGQLRPDQEATVNAMLRHDIGGLQAPTAFGKTVVAAAILARRGVNTLVQTYGRVIVDECHHIAAACFEAILRQVKARYVLGLSATLVRPRSWNW